MVFASRYQLVGRTLDKYALVDAVARANTLNLTGHVNYNMYGDKDGVGFVCVTDKFIDNFLLKTIVPDYNMTNGRNDHVGSQNRIIRELLKKHGFPKSEVKAINLAKVRDNVPDYLLENIANKDPNIVNPVYYVQDFKIAAPDLDYGLVMSFIRAKEYNRSGFYLKDIDVTQDFSGSFEKNEIVSYLVKNCGFRLQGEHDFVSARTIVDNDCMVGRNCMTFIEEIDGIVVRQKMYNKMTQSLESKSVRSSVGAHWKDWVSQTNTRLSAARDKSTERGLTRTEATFYVTEEDIPDDDFIHDVLNRIVEYIPKGLVYSTPFSAVWRIYCDSMKHSLVCVDRTENVAVLVYTYNELTQNISGHNFDNWIAREKWILEKLTLNGNLPIDVIDINRYSPINTAADVKKSPKIGEHVEVTGSRYYKVNPDCSTVFKTRLVSRNGCYSYNNASQETNAYLLEKAGFVEHTNCVPFLAKSKASGTSKTSAEFRLVDGRELDIKLDIRKFSRATKNHGNDSYLAEEVRHIEEIRQPLLTELAKKKEKLTLLNNYIKQFSATKETAQLRDLELGKYDVIAARKECTRFGDQYRLLMQIGDMEMLVWGNAFIKTALDVLAKTQEFAVLDKATDFLGIYNRNIAVIEITGKGRNSYGHITVYCTIAFTDLDGNVGVNVMKSNTECDIERCDEEILASTSMEGAGTSAATTIPRENLLNYSDYPDLITLTPGSVYKVSAIGYISYYGKDRLLVKLDDKIYLAGDDLEEKAHLITNNSYIKLLKIRLNKNRKKVMLCSVIKHGDWHELLDYTKAPILSNLDGSNCILDIKTVVSKGKKRKLLLSNDGNVYRLKKSKLEDSIAKPGFY